MRLELAWGRVRRWYLRNFRRGFVQRMRASRRGGCEGCTHDVLDPRDLKYVRNRCGYWWSAEDDPFAWRDALPFCRVGLAEILVSGVGCFIASLIAWWVWRPAIIVPLVVFALILWFFRNPPRQVPVQPDLVVAPADGHVVSVERIDDSFVGRAVAVGIFLSVFNVHANRSPSDAWVVGQTYTQGKFLNALRPSSARK